MARIVGIGHQDFETVRRKNNFYIDKTEFIKEWWENQDAWVSPYRTHSFFHNL